MRVSIDWLGDFVDVEEDAATLASRLTLAGFEVEAVERLGEGLDAVVVAEVRGLRPHPGADRLTLVTVSDGRGEREVVCGAANVPAPGGRVALVPPDTTLPTGLTVQARKVRGVISPGMLASERELGIGEDAEGILVLPPDAPVGRPVAGALGLRDTVLDVAVAPNRPDAMSHLGIAREVAALTGRPLRLPDTSLGGLEGGRPAGDAVAVEIAAPDLCPRYTARVVEGARHGPSPWPARRRLRAAGVRPIDAIVDATNYALLELGHPLHAFDLARLAGPRIVVRAARDGERMTTLDGAERALLPSDLLICDAERPVALAGVMGGAGSEVTAATTRVLIECAGFSPAAVRRTSRRLDLRSESALRFERGVDPAGADAASRRCARLIAGWAGGRVAPGVVDVYPRPAAPVRVRLRPSRARALIGRADLADADMAGALSRLGLKVAAADGALDCAVPAFRQDLAREADLCEEVARLTGLDAIPPALPALRDPPRASGDPVSTRARDALCGAGLCETVSLAFADPGRLDAFDGGAARVRLRNPLRADQTALRTTLLPGLLDALAHNLGHRVPGVRLFEVGCVFLPRRDPLPHEPRRAAGLIAGTRPRHLARDAEVDFADLRGAIDHLAGAFAVELCTARSDAPAAWQHPGEAAEVRLAGRAIGLAGRLHPEVAARRGIDVPCYLFELDLEALPPPAPAALRPVPRVPAVVRDVSLLVSADLPWARLRDAVRGAPEGRGLVESVRLVEDYREPGRVPEGSKALVASLTWRDPERTLTDQEVNEAHEALVARLCADLGAARR